MTPRELIDSPDESAFRRGREPISRVNWAGHDAWLLTRFDDVRAALSDRRLVPHIPGVTAGPGSIFLMSGSPHTRLRGLLTHALSARRARAGYAITRRLCRTRVADLIAAGPPMDLLADYAAPVAVGALGQLLGVSIVERDGFAAWSSQLNAVFSTDDPEQMARAGGELAGFVASLVAEKLACPSSDLISALCAARDADGVGLTESELVGLVFSVLGAGYLPPARAAVLGLLRLLLDPPAADTLRQHPTRLATAVEELLRLDPGGYLNVDRVLRAVESLRMRGITIHAGDYVIAPLGAANRDPDRFPDPDTLRLDRTPNPHLAFAPGAHHCLGAPLARMQLSAMIGTVLTALPSLKLATGLDNLTWHMGFGGAKNLAALPVDWQPDL